MARPKGAQSKKATLYGLYDAFDKDLPIAIGTANELKEKFNINHSTFYTCLRDNYLIDKKYRVIKIELDDDE